MVPSQETRDWELFVDWCDSTGVSSLPAELDTIAAFLQAMPAALSTHGRRVRSIRKRHEAAGLVLDLPRAAPARPWRDSEDRAALPRALAQLPTYRHRKGLATALRARRDGWLLVLVGLLNLSRNEARSIREGAVSLFPDLTVNGQRIDSSEPPAECPACAVTRWLRVAGAASFGWRQDIVEAISPEGSPLESHDCRSGLDGSWRRAATLLPAIDQHGWVSASLMSARSVSSVIAERQVIGEVDSPRAAPATASAGRFSRASMDELASAYDDVDEQAAALLLRLQAIVGEGDEVLGHIRDLTA